MFLSIKKKRKCIKNCTFAQVYQNFVVIINEEGLYLIYKNLIVHKKEANVIACDIKSLKYYLLNCKICTKKLNDIFFILSLFH